MPATPVLPEERLALTIAAYDLDLHLVPAAGREEARVQMTVRNRSVAPVGRVPLQISSTLRWQSIAAVGTKGLEAVAFSQSPVATDTDHTGYAQEAVVTLPQALAPGATVTLTAFYTGEIRQSSDRLELIGSSKAQADAADWDRIAPAADSDTATALRGFGNVLWYPVIEPTAFLGDGNKLFRLIAEQKLAQATTTIRLRLTVEYAGDPPTGAVFNGELQTLAAAPDAQDQLVVESRGLATANFIARPLGFRAASLFLTAQQPTPLAEGMVTLISPAADHAAAYSQAALGLEPLLSAWLHAERASPMLLLDHPGDAYTDHALLVTAIDRDAKPDQVAPALIGPLVSARLHSVHPWIEEGLKAFLRLLWLERSQGRQAALTELQSESMALALAEPASVAGQSEPGEPLLHASSDIYLRTKAAAVWWQLREIVGEDALRQAVMAYARAASLIPASDQDPHAMQKAIERAAGRDLSWFFADWVDRDRSLPDLSVVQANPRPLPARPGRSAGVLIAIEVRNDGDAVAEVPVTVRSGTFSATERLRIPAQSSTSTRILFEGLPEMVEVNDGSTPELRTSVHTFRVK